MLVLLHNVLLSYKWTSRFAHFNAFINASQQIGK